MIVNDDDDGDDDDDDDDGDDDDDDDDGDDDEADYRCKVQEISPCKLWWAQEKGTNLYHYLDGFVQSSHAGKDNDDMKFGNLGKEHDDDDDYEMKFENPGEEHVRSRSVAWSSP